MNNDGEIVEAGGGLPYTAMPGLTISVKPGLTGHLGEYWGNVDWSVIE